MISQSLDAGRPALIPIFMGKTKKASGFVTEAQRHTERVTLRLPPDVAAMLRDAAYNHEMKLNEYVAALLIAMRDRPEAVVCDLLEDLRPAPGEGTQSERPEQEG